MISNKIDNIFFSTHEILNMKTAFPVLIFLIISLLAPPLSIGNLYSEKNHEESLVSLDVCHKHPAYQYQSSINMNMFDLSSFISLSLFSEDVKPININSITKPIDPPPKSNPPDSKHIARQLSF